MGTPQSEANQRFSERAILASVETDGKSQNLDLPGSVAISALRCERRPALSAFWTHHDSLLAAERTDDNAKAHKHETADEAYNGQAADNAHQKKQGPQAAADACEFAHLRLNQSNVASRTCRDGRRSRSWPLSALRKVSATEAAANRFCFDRFRAIRALLLAHEIHLRRSYSNVDKTITF